MKRISLAVLSIALMSSILYAQQKTSGRTSGAYIEVAGVKLQLGMTKATVAERFVGTQTTEVDESYWKVGNVGDVRFKNDKLIRNQSRPVRSLRQGHVPHPLSYNPSFLQAVYQRRLCNPSDLGD